MERIVAGLMAEPARAGELLVRQSPGWLQVRPFMQDRPTWVEIDLDAVAGNVRQAQHIVGAHVGLCAVLKADGYGHGAVSVARTALNNGAAMLAVACLAEAITLRRAAIEAPILVLGYTPAWQARETVRYDVTAAVYDLDVARALSQAAADLNRPALVHIKVDTGMARLGLLPGEVLAFVQQALALPGLRVEGIFTHFSVADSVDPEHVAHTEAQVAAFEAVLVELDAAGIRPPVVHASNSAAMLSRRPRTSRWYDWVSRIRPGAVGGRDTSGGFPAGPALENAGGPGQGIARRFAGQLWQHLSYRAGDHAGGHASGLCRRLPPGALPLGTRAAARTSGADYGRVTMDQTMLDVTDIPGVRQGDEVVLIGRQGDEEITVEQVAERLGTISYEVVSEILARVPRIT